MTGIAHNFSKIKKSLRISANIIFSLFLIAFMVENSFCLQRNNFELQQFTDIYEPSAVVVHPGKGVIVLEDEGKKVVHLLEITGSKDKLQLEPVASYKVPVKVNDLEGAAIGKKTGKNSEIVAITSHSVTKSGKKKASRELLLGLSLENNKVTVESKTGLLLPYIEEKLKKELKMDSSQVSNINIEAICFTPEKDTLLLGLRTPLKDGKAIVLKLGNPYEFLGSEGKTRADFSGESSTLDLGGGGIRAMTYDKENRVYLIANEVKNKKGKPKARLWAWDGKTRNSPKRLYQMYIKGNKIKNIEGIAIVQHKEDRFFLLVCDDGKKSKNEGAHYLFLPAKIR